MATALSPSQRALGQVFTPRPIADWMARWCCADSPRRILDPAVGTGVLVDAVENCLTGPRPAPRMDGYEIDPAMRVKSKRAKGASSYRFIGCDFIREKTSFTYDAIIANPPYVRHHEFVRSEKLFEEFDAQTGGRISRLTNLYGLFLLKIWSILSERGRAAVITPAEWLNADFGRQLKAYFLRENAIDAIVHFAHGSNIFDGAMTTAAITLLRRGRVANEPIRFATVEDAGELSQLRLPGGGREFLRSQLDPAKKWRILFEDAKSTPRLCSATLGDVAACRRGIATGANSYFTLRPSDLAKNRIDPRDVKLCITKAQQIATPSLSRRDVDHLRRDDERIYLFDPRSDIDMAVKRYLKLGQKMGIDRRYLPAHRPVWYRPEVREPAPILVSVFARRAFKFVRNDARVLNLTAFHGIYPRNQSRQAIGALFEYLRGDAANAALQAHVRIYARGLFKLEPRDVEAIPIPTDVFEACR